uniref:NAC domain-containing protein n=1 Tax=Leersia perrieri TaxID=77586 RepID=A0A0D9WIN2_9ORYZ
MAELEKGKQIVADSGGDGGGEKRRPVGFRFKPREAEVVEYYLVPRLQGSRIVPNPAIVVNNVYQFEPERLIKEKCKGWIGDEEEWYFLSPRDRKYKNGSRPSRNTEDRVGRWKASTGKTASKTMICSGTTRFFVTSLVYFKGPVKTETKTKWLMREYTIPLFENKLDKSGASTSTSSDSGKEEEEEDVEEEEDGWVAACALFELEPDAAEISDKQAGKRPISESSAAAAAAQKTKRPFVPPPAPVIAGPRGVVEQYQPIYPMQPRPPQPQPMMMMNKNNCPQFQLMMQGNNGMMQPSMCNFRPAPAPASAYNGHRQQQPAAAAAAMQQGFRPVFTPHAQMQQQRRPIQLIGQALAAPVSNNYHMPPLQQQQPVQRGPIQYRGQAAPVSNNFHTQQQQPVQWGSIQYRGQVAPVSNNFHAPPAPQQQPVQLLPVHQMQWGSVQQQQPQPENDDVTLDPEFEAMLLKELENMAEEEVAFQPFAGDGGQ